MLNNPVSTWRITLTSAARFGFTAAMAVWLALFAPMLCQYHGLMWNHQHMDMTMEDAAWDTPMPAMDMESMPEMSAAEHQQHLHHHMMHSSATSVQTQPKPSLQVHRAVLPLSDTSDSDSASMYNRVPSVATMLVSIMLIHTPGHYLAVACYTDTTRVHPESSTFPLQLTVPPLEQPPRA